jgi:hypothetical protein
MKTQKINISFTSYTDGDFETKAEYIHSSMTGNAAFTDPIPTLAEVQAAITQYSAFLVAAATLGRTAVADKNKSRKQLELLLGQLGMYVMYIANGDAAILTSSGFTLSKAREVRYITNPGNVVLTNGITSGVLTATVKAVAGATGYLYEISSTAPDDAPAWESTSSTRAKFTFKNLQPGKRYWIRVAATGSGEQIAFSPVASQFAQ